MNIDHHEAARRTTELYRHFDAEGRLLYIGVSLSALYRMRGHRRVARWFNQIVTITVERFESRTQALAAIRSEKPLFNVAHCGFPATIARALSGATADELHHKAGRRLVDKLRRRREAMVAAASAGPGERE